MNFFESRLFFEQSCRMISNFPTSAGSGDVMRVMHLPLLSTNTGFWLSVQARHSAAACRRERVIRNAVGFAGCHWANGVQSSFSPEYSNLTCVGSLREREGETTAAA